MPYDWRENGSQDAPPRAELVPAGRHWLTISRIVYGSKADGPFQSKAGDPQIMLILADDDGRECSLMVTLSTRAGWVLAKILLAAGADVDRMTADGVKPVDFANPAFAELQLVQTPRRLFAEVDWVQQGGKDYPVVTPIRRDAVAAMGEMDPAGGAAMNDAKIDEADIPF